MTTKGAETMGTTTITAEPGAPTIIVEREFDATEAELRNAFLDPDLYARWIGPRRLTNHIDHMDATPNGSWRFVSTDPADGGEYAFNGVYHGDPWSGPIVSTFEYEGTPGHVSLNTAEFEERGGRTLLRQISVFQRVEDRDAMVTAGMETGVRDGMDRLDELMAGA
jgi:uncharacterized protein YndB with AHSA1/START domain